MKQKVKNAEKMNPPRVNNILLFLSGFIGEKGLSSNIKLVPLDADWLINSTVSKFF